METAEISWIIDTEDASDVSKESTFFQIKTNIKLAHFPPLKQRKERKILELTRR